jgi:D-3-phosphoglycerate dehydrogenase / 2-oxoglutarate reductase
VRVVGTNLGRLNRAHLLEAWGQRFNVQLENHITLFLYRDLPGMLGHVGTVFGEHGINIVSAAVGRQPEGQSPGNGGHAAMAIATDVAVPPSLVDEIVSSEGFEAGRSVTL